MSNKPPIPTKPKEVICFYPIEFPTQEGDAYIYIAKDVFSQMLFQTGVETDNSAQSVLKHLELLMKDKEFSKYNTPFTLVLHKYQEVKEEIEAIIKPFNGTVMFNDLYLVEHFTDVIEHFYKSMANRQS